MGVLESEIGLQSTGGSDFVQKAGKLAAGLYHRPVVRALDYSCFFKLLPRVDKGLVGCR